MSNVASTLLPFLQQCRSNVRLCCQKRQQCRTSFVLKFRPFDKVERCFDIVASVDRALPSPRPLQHCIGCVCQNGSISRWLSRRSACCMASLHHIWISWFASLTCLVVADFVHPRHNYSMFRLFVGLQCWSVLVSCSSIRSLELPDNGHSAIAVFTYLPSTAQDISFS